MLFQLRSLTSWWTVGLVPSDWFTEPSGHRDKQSPMSQSLHPVLTLNSSTVLVPP